MTENNILIDESIDVGEYIEFDELLHVVSQIKTQIKVQKIFNYLVIRDTVKVLFL